MTSGYRFAECISYRKSPHLLVDQTQSLAFIQNIVFVTAWKILIHLESPFLIKFHGLQTCLSKQSVACRFLFLPSPCILLIFLIKYLTGITNAMHCVYVMNTFLRLKDLLGIQILAWICTGCFYPLHCIILPC